MLAPCQKEIQHASPPSTRNTILFNWKNVCSVFISKWLLVTDQWSLQLRINNHFPYVKSEEIIWGTNYCTIWMTSMNLSLLYVLLKTNGGGVFQLCSNTVKITVLSNLSAGRHFITDRRLGKAFGSSTFCSHAYSTNQFSPDSPWCLCAFCLCCAGSTSPVSRTTEQLGLMAQSWSQSQNWALQNWMWIKFKLLFQWPDQLSNVQITGSLSSITAWRGGGFRY